ncbi:MAG: 50S ribosomal protein L19 [Alphaproteobacteria bacterium]|nr:50S ribosomal protein L19 [Alphaproteobacteria bacterium]MBL0718201.1 50S ribosomal protein L19 [Alphaproteobacteria bacterium]
MDFAKKSFSKIMGTSKNLSHAEFSSGDTIAVHFKIKEGESSRIQIFEGVCIGINRNSETFIVRKESFGDYIEKLFPFNSPLVEKIELKRTGRVRRSKINYIRKLSGKKARLKEDFNAVKKAKLKAVAKSS